MGLPSLRSVLVSLFSPVEIQAPSRTFYPNDAMSPIDTGAIEVFSFIDCLHLVSKLNTQTDGPVFVLRNIRGDNARFALETVRIGGRSSVVESSDIHDILTVLTSICRSHGLALPRPAERCFEFLDFMRDNTKKFMNFLSAVNSCNNRLVRLGCQPYGEQAVLYTLTMHNCKGSVDLRLHSVQQRGRSFRSSYETVNV